MHHFPILPILFGLYCFCFIFSAADEEPPCFLDCKRLKIVAKIDNSEVYANVAIEKGVVSTRVMIPKINVLPGGKDCLKNESGDEIGLMYHIHDRWTNEDSHTGLGPHECGNRIASGHYDPSLACGPATSNQGCAQNGGCVGPSGPNLTYQCSPQDFYERNPFFCEVGDLSSKHGPLKLIDTGYHETFIGQATYQDLYLENSCVLKERSIVFHCQDGTRAFCAKFIPYIMPSHI